MQFPLVRAALANAHSLESVAGWRVSFKKGMGFGWQTDARLNKFWLAETHCVCYMLITSRAKRMPENCQHVSGGKKLRKLARMRSSGMAQDPPRNTYWFTMDLLLYSPTASSQTRDMGSLELGFAGL